MAEREGPKPRLLGPHLSDYGDNAIERVSIRTGAHSSELLLRERRPTIRITYDMRIILCASDGFDRQLTICRQVILRLASILRYIYILEQQLATLQPRLFSLI